MDDAKKPQQAIVRNPKVYSGTHGPYVAVHCPRLGTGREGSVTFSLHPKTWEEGPHRKPKSGDIVIVSDFRRHLNGWRAEQARLFRPSDGEVDPILMELKKKLEPRKKKVLPPTYPLVQEAAGSAYGPYVPMREVSESNGSDGVRAETARSARAIPGGIGKFFEIFRKLKESLRRN